MTLRSILVASLVAALPAAGFAQPMDAPPGGSMPSPETGGVVGGGPAPVAAEAPKQKEGPYFGFSFGTGNGSIGVGGTAYDLDEQMGYAGESPTTMAMMLRFGFGSGDFLFGAQFNWIRTFIDVSGTEVGMDFRGFDLVGTLWSQEMGLYTRVGIGPAQVRGYVGSSESDPVSGVELMLGLGATMGGLGVGIDLIRQNYDVAEAGFDYVQYMLVTLSLDLY
jgi:hypothetical protein